MRRFRGWALGCALSAVACSSSSSTSGGGSASVSGTLGGSAVPTTETIAVSGPVTTTTASGTFTANVIAVFISNQHGVCGIAQRMGNPPNATLL
ncbi:MAG TPA: hypothetical protein VE987_12360, partial [Polyangiaceae bacterium]|nr:hypothetical protein [Polyangiaceae bacterium]